MNSLTYFKTIINNLLVAPNKINNQDHILLSFEEFSYNY